MKENLFINGDWVEGQGKFISSHSPWNSEIIWSGFCPSLIQINEAITSAVSGGMVWASISIDERLSYLKKFVNLIENSSEEFSYIIALEAGKPIWEARQEVGALQGKLAASLKAFEQRASTIKMDMKLQGVSGSVETVFLPYGVSLVLGPYNYPVHMANGHIMPALLAGNSVIYKCSEYGIASSSFYTKLMAQVDLPKGVFSFLPGDGDIGKQLLEDNRIRAVYFTGSENIGKNIREYCAIKNKRCAIEAGGNSSIYIEDFDDEDGAIETIVQSAYWGAGQRCNSTRNLILNSKIASNDFFQKLIQRISNLNIINRVDSTSFYGPMRRKEDLKKLLDLQDSLEEKGANILIRSKLIDDSELLLSPCLLKMPNESDLYFEEIVGPMLRIHVVDTTQQAICLINNVTLRLAVCVVSTSEEVLQYFLNYADYGAITWNCPTTGASAYAAFGGHGESGNHSPAGFLSVDYCVNAKSVMKKNTTKVIS